MRKQGGPPFSLLWSAALSTVRIALSGSSWERAGGQFLWRKGTGVLRSSAALGPDVRCRGPLACLVQGALCCGCVPPVVGDLQQRARSWCCLLQCEVCS